MQIFISAQEASGDFIGSKLMDALRKNVEADFFGIGGPLMVQEDLREISPYGELNLMGIGDIIPHLRLIRSRLNEIAEVIMTNQPNVIITIDSLGFHYQLAKKLKKLGSKVPLVHYVAPQVWAWRPKRAKKMAHFFNHLLTLYPFEPAYFIPHGLKTTFVGHPLLEIPVKEENFHERFSLSLNVSLITVLLGSRLGEITRHLDIFSQAMTKVADKHPVHFIVPTFPEFADQITISLNKLNVPFTLITNPNDKFAAYQASIGALAVSGTVSLELAYFQVPQIIAYRASSFTYAIAKRLIKVKYASMVNLLLDRPIVPEFIQNDCTINNLTNALTQFLFESQLNRQKLMQDYQQALKLLNAGALPSEMAAKIIKSYF